MQRRFRNGTVDCDRTRRYRITKGESGHARTSHQQEQHPRHSACRRRIAAARARRRAPQARSFRADLQQRHLRRPGRGHAELLGFLPRARRLRQSPSLGFRHRHRIQRPRHCRRFALLRLLPARRDARRHPAQNRNRLHRHSPASRRQSRALQRLYRRQRRPRLRCGVRAGANTLPPALRHRLVGRRFHQAKRRQERRPLQRLIQNRARNRASTAPTRRRRTHWPHIARQRSLRARERPL